MRRKIGIIEQPPLNVHVEYDHLTIGELGNILIRLQAALRSIAGLTPGEYDGRYSEEKPQFITSSVNTSTSIDIATSLAIMAFILSTPSIVRDWQIFGKSVFNRFKLGLYVLIHGDGRYIQNDDLPPEMEVSVKKGSINIDAEIKELDKITPAQRAALLNLIWSLTGPAKQVDIEDEESGISLMWHDKEDNEV